MGPGRLDLSFLLVHSKVFFKEVFTKDYVYVWIIKHTNKGPATQSDRMLQLLSKVAV